MSGNKRKWTFPKLDLGYPSRAVPISATNINESPISPRLSDESPVNSATSSASSSSTSSYTSPNSAPFSSPPTSPKIRSPRVSSPRGSNSDNSDDRETLGVSPPSYNNPFDLFGLPTGTSESSLIPGLSTTIPTSPNPATSPPVVSSLTQALIGSSERDADEDRPEKLHQKDTLKAYHEVNKNIELVKQATLRYSKAVLGSAPSKKKHVFVYTDRMLVCRRITPIRRYMIEEEIFYEDFSLRTNELSNEFFLYNGEITHHFFLPTQQDAFQQSPNVSTSFLSSSPSFGSSFLSSSFSPSSFVPSFASTSSSNLMMYSPSSAFSFSTPLSPTPLSPLSHSGPISYPSPSSPPPSASAPPLTLTATFLTDIILETMEKHLDIRSDLRPFHTTALREAAITTVGIVRRMNELTMPSNIDNPKLLAHLHRTLLRFHQTPSSILGGGTSPEPLFHRTIKTHILDMLNCIAGPYFSSSQDSEEHEKQSSSCPLPTPDNASSFFQPAWPITLPEFFRLYATSTRSVLDAHTSMNWVATLRKFVGALPAAVSGTAPTGDRGSTNIAAGSADFQTELQNRRVYATAQALIDHLLSHHIDLHNSLVGLALSPLAVSLTKNTPSAPSTSCLGYPSPELQAIITEARSKSSNPAAGLPQGNTNMATPSRPSISSGMGSSLMPSFNSSSDPIQSSSNLSSKSRSNSGINTSPKSSGISTSPKNNNVRRRRSSSGSRDDESSSIGSSEELTETADQRAALQRIYSDLEELVALVIGWSEVPEDKSLAGVVRQTGESLRFLWHQQQFRPGSLVIVSDNNNNSSSSSKTNSSSNGDSNTAEATEQRRFARMLGRQPNPSVPGGYLLHVTIDPNEALDGGFIVADSEAWLPTNEFAQRLAWPNLLVCDPIADLLNRLSQLADQQLHTFFEDRLELDMEVVDTLLKSGVPCLTRFLELEKITITLHHLLRDQVALNDAIRRLTSSVVQLVTEAIESPQFEHLYHPNLSKTTSDLARYFESFSRLTVHRVVALKNLSQEALASIDSKKDAILSGAQKTAVTEQWLEMIDEAVVSFLQQRGFSPDSIPSDYISMPPTDIIVIEAQHHLLRQMLDLAEDSFGVKNFVKTLSVDIQRVVANYRADIVAVLCCFLPLPNPSEERTDEERIEIFRHLLESVSLNSAPLDPTSAVQCRALIEDLRYLAEMERMETEFFKHGGQGRGELSHVVPISGLIMAKFHILEQELRTILEIWKPAGQKSKTSEPAMTSKGSTPSLFRRGFLNKAERSSATTRPKPIRIPRLIASQRLPPLRSPPTSPTTSPPSIADRTSDSSSSSSSPSPPSSSLSLSPASPPSSLSSPSSSSSPGQSPSSTSSSSSSSSSSASSASSYLFPSPSSLNTMPFANIQRADIQHLFEQSPRVLQDFRGQNGESYLHQTVSSSSFELDESLVASLLSLGLFIDARDNTGSTPLMAACRTGSIVSIYSLLQAGANPSILDNTGASAFHALAARTLPHEDVERHSAHFATIFAKFVALCGVDFPAQTGDTPLLAALSGDCDITTITILLDLGANPNSQNREGKSPVFVAFERGHQDIAQLLLNHQQKRSS